MTTFRDVPHQSAEMVGPDRRPTLEWWRWFSDFLAGTRHIAGLTGTVTFAAATTAAVTFANAEPDTNYNVAIDSPENKTFWITSKTTSGFTINASSATSATVGWTAVRR